MSNAKQAIYERHNATKNDTTVSFNKAYRAITSTASEATLLTQVLFWFDKGKSNQHESKVRTIRDGYLWLAKRHTDWWYECGLSANEARTAIDKLVSRGFLITGDYRSPFYGGKKVQHIRPNYNAINTALSEYDDITNGFMDSDEYIEQHELMSSRYLNSYYSKLSALSNKSFDHIPDDTPPQKKTVKRDNSHLNQSTSSDEPEHINRCTRAHQPVYSGSNDNTDTITDSLSEKIKDSYPFTRERQAVDFSFSFHEIGVNNDICDDIRLMLSTIYPDTSQHILDKYASDIGCYLQAYCEGDYMQIIKTAYASNHRYNATRQAIPALYNAIKNTLTRGNPTLMTKNYSVYPSTG